MQSQLYERPMQDSEIESQVSCVFKRWDYEPLVAKAEEEGAHALAMKSRHEESFSASP